MKRLLIAFTAIAAFFTACDIGPLQDAVDNFALVIGLEPINTNASVLVYDAVTNDLVSTEISVTVGGPNGDQVIDIFSDPVDTTEFAGGVFNFGLNNNFMPTESNPASIALTFDAPGYLQTVIEVQLADTGLTDMEVDMIPLNALPENIVVGSDQTETDSEGNPVPPESFDPEDGLAKLVASGGATQNIDGKIKKLYRKMKKLRSRPKYSLLALKRLKVKIKRSQQLRNRYPYRYAYTTKKLLVLGTGQGVQFTGLTPIPVIEGNNYLPTLQVNGNLFDTDGSQIAEVLNDDEDATDEQLAVQWVFLGRLSIVEGLTTFREITAGNGFLIKAKQANYSDAQVSSLARVNLSAASFDALEDSDEFQNVITGDDLAPKIAVITITGQSDPYVFIAQDGEQFEYQTFAVRYENKQMNFGININLQGQTADIDYTMRLQSLGRVTQLRKSKTENLVPTITIGAAVPDLDAIFNYSAEVQWGTFVENFNPTEVSNTVNLDVPAQPNNVTTGTVEVSLVCANGAAGISLSNLPATPIQYRKSGSGDRWRQAAVNWNYSKEEKVLKGGSFEATVENGQNYDFRISVDGTLYPKNGPEVRAINFVDGQFNFDFDIDNDDFCQE